MAFSIGEAVGEGFSLIGRKPLSLAGWALAYVIFAVITVALIGGMMLTALLPIIRSAGATPDPAAVMAVLPSLFGAFALLLPLALIFHSILAGAVFRAVLEPDNSSFFYLRFGAQELWLAVVFLVEGLIFVLLYFAAAIVIATLSAIGGRSAGGLLFFLGVLGMLGGFLYLGVRLSLAGPATFVERRFALFDSWALTRSNAGPLFLTALVVILICIGIWFLQLILSIFTNVAGMAAGGALSSGDPQALQQALSNPAGIFAVLGPIFVVQLVVGAIFYAVYLAVMNAPWANAYSQIKGPSDTPAVFS